MFNLNLNFLLSFESIYVEQKNAYIDYEIRTQNRIDRNTEIGIGGWDETRRHIPIQTQVPGYTFEIGRENQQVHRRCIELYGHQCASMVESIQQGRYRCNQDQECAKAQTYFGQDGTRKNCPRSREEESPKHSKGQRRSGKRTQGETLRIHSETFFRSFGARYKRIRLTPKGVPSPPLYELFLEKLQELENLYNSGHINLFFGDESHVCTNGYVPYGWQFPDENVAIPAQKAARLNIFGMVNRDNEYHGFTTRENINSDKFIEFIDELVPKLEKPTVLLLDNASLHKSKKVKAKIAEWQDGNLYIMYLPPYSPHLNIAETLWRILKGKWIKPEHYESTDTLFSAVKEILDGIGKEYMVAFSHAA